MLPTASTKMILVPLLRKLSQIIIQHGQVKFGTQNDIMYIDVLDRSCQKDEEEDWTNLASNEKWKIDASFLKLFNLHA